LTLAAIRRVLELEEKVKALQAQRDALLGALAERDRLLATLVGRPRPDVPERANPPEPRPSPDVGG